MKRDEFLKYLTKKKLLPLCYRITGGDNLYKDLFQETFLLILEIPDEKIEEIHCPECFFLKLADRAWNSKTSRFYYKYRRKPDEYELKINLDSTEENYDEEADKIEAENLHKLHNIIEDIYWYDRDVFLSYLQEGSIRKVTKKTNIPKSSVALTVKKVKQIINENFISSQ